MALYTVTDPLTTIFTPPASCSSSWTYEASYFNAIPSGLLIQRADADGWDNSCFPSGFEGYGRVITELQVFSPGACPKGYSTAQNSFNGAITTAICCPTSYQYTLFESSANYESTSTIYQGCLSNYPANAAATTVLGRASTGSIELTTTVVNGPLTMWAQPLYVAFRSNDVTLFTTSTSSSARSTSTSASTPTSSSVASSTITSAPATSSSASSTPSPSGSGSSSLSGGAIAGIAIGCAAVLGILIGLAIYFRRPSRRRAGDEAGVAAAGSGAGGPGGSGGEQQQMAYAGGYGQQGQSGYGQEPVRYSGYPKPVLSELPVEERKPGELDARTGPVELG